MKNRRELLIQRMHDLETQGLSCQGCAGTCCTYEANSMMTTPLEAFELLHYLRNEKLLTDELKQKCVEAVQKYRLEHEFGNGRRSYLRRTYTCPFFNHRELGCPLPREVKPYGCLAFNSHHTESKASEHCYSEKHLLEERERQNLWEEKQNEFLKTKFQLSWNKSPLPTALLDLWEKDFSVADLSAN